MTDDVLKIHIKSVLWITVSQSTILAKPQIIYNNG